VCLRGEVHVLLELYSGMSYSAVDHEFKVNKSTIQYIQKKERKFTDL
jgi:transposase